MFDALKRWHDREVIERRMRENKCVQCGKFEAALGTRVCISCLVKEQMRRGEPEQEQQTEGQA